MDYEYDLGVVTDGTELVCARSQSADSNHIVCDTVCKVVFIQMVRGKVCIMREQWTSESMKSSLSCKENELSEISFIVQTPLFSNSLHKLYSPH